MSDQKQVSIQVRGKANATYFVQQGGKLLSPRLFTLEAAEKWAADNGYTIAAKPKAKAKSVSSLASEIREEGEAWKAALSRASKMRAGKFV